MAVDAEKVRFMPDLLGLLRGFESANKQLILAARITGTGAAGVFGPVGNRRSWQRRGRQR